MGASGIGSFDNDDAADFVAEIVESEGLDAIRDALALDDDYVEVDGASRALVAAEIIAALRGNASPSLPDDLAAWVTSSPADVDALAPVARKALDRVAKSSELRELWEESPDFDAWRKGVLELRERLA